MPRDTTDGRSNGDARSSDGPTATRRSVLRTAAAGATGLAVGAGAIGSGTASGIPTPPLTRCGNSLLDPTGQEVILRGVTIADPGRQLRPQRGQTAAETVALALDESATPPSGSWAAEQGVEGWHNDVIRIPIQPQDVYAGTDNASATPASAMPHGDAWGPVLPAGTGDSPAPITEETLTEYVEEILDPLIDQIERAGAYAMLAYHRHYHVYQQVAWPGDCDPTVGYGGGNCGERGVLWHGADQVEAVKSNAPDAHTRDHEHWTEPRAVAEALDDEITTFWRFVADEYADRDHVCFDVYPEPTGPYADPWGAPDRAPPSYTAPVRDPRQEPVWWDLWVERAQPWLDVVEENAPGSVASIGSPRWSRYTYHAGVTSEFDVDELQLCYTGQIQMQDFDVDGHFGPPSESVPLFFSGFGWAEGGGRFEEGWLDGTATSGATAASEHFESFVEEYPVHPVASTFDHTWQPTFFDHEEARGPEAGDWMAHLASFESRPGQWWMEYLARRDGQDDPSDGSDRNPCGDRDTPYPIVGDNERPARDPDGDGLLEDVNGNGEQDLADAVDLYQYRDSDEVRSNERYFDFSGNDHADLADVVQLFQENTA